MMNRTKCIFVLVCIFVFSFSFGGTQTLAAQQKKPRKPPKTAEPTSPVSGKPIRIIRTDGLEITGKLVSIDMQKIVYENTTTNEKLPLALESVAVIMIGEPPKPKTDVRFIEDAATTVNALLRMAAFVDADT